MPVLLENLLLHTVKGGDLKRFGLAMKAIKANEGHEGHEGYESNERHESHEVTKLHYLVFGSRSQKGVLLIDHLKVCIYIYIKCTSFTWLESLYDLCARPFGASLAHEYHY